MGFDFTSINLPEKPEIECKYFMNAMCRYGFDKRFKGGNEFIDDTLFRYYEEVASRIKYLKIKPGDIMIDVGASCGSWAIPTALQGAKVYAFEIGVPQINTIMLNMAMNGLVVGDNNMIQVYDIALVNRDGLDVLFNKTNACSTKRICKPTY